ncbi:fungal-specific transcription factor [Microdochium trichocladiopsis]|uniref:Fungal-specific transcription factor n=1 Tax=Microdochium trichocladiopsis TaxID=1682393 RepID=A0A9P8Y118_9PEZI|nr:fungal-specific transcription factor [Microdochium trichocladiopsis]KAH7026540.1 fungal-specific transcription factor [Microdochium trichocladiopsis]
MSPNDIEVIDLSPEDSGSQAGDDSPVAGSNTKAGEDAHGNANVPKPKRLACMICRKRKLRCDGVRPSCSTCTRLGHQCAYDEVRRKSGPKRGYVKALEERLKQVEQLLSTKGQETPPANAGSDRTNRPRVAFDQTPAQANTSATAFPSINPPNSHSDQAGVSGDWHFSQDPAQNAAADDFNFAASMGMDLNGMGNNFTWEMIGLGLDEPLPPQETIDELHQVYFEKIHPSMPMIHKYRYLAAMNLSPNQRPPVCLRYAMWTLASSVMDKYQGHKDLFYQRARKYVEMDFMKGYGEHMISVAHAQTHILLSSYEFKMMYFPRAWQSTGQAIRLCQMTGLHRLDGAGLEVKECLAPPRDWTEREERRRTFWMAFCNDRYASIGTGWPMSIDERDIRSNLPSSEEAFEMSRPEQTQPLTDCMNPTGATKLSPFGGIVLMACLFGRNLVHLHRPDTDEKDHDLNGEFWKRHRNLDNILLNTSLCLPSNLKLPAGLGNPNIVFTNMNIHTSTICLHQAAIFKADKNRLPAAVSAESKVRCITAANEIASIMRMVSHMDLSAMNPFISFCLYVSARVFVQYLKSRPEDSQTADSLRFLLAAMNALKRKNPLTESFLVQLDVDLEALGLKIPKLKSAFPRSEESVSRTFSNRAHITRAELRTNPENVKGRAEGGTFKHTNECQFLKIAEDGGNPVETPDLVEPEPGPSQSVHTQVWGRFTRGEQSFPPGEESAGGNGGNLGMPPSAFGPGSGNVLLEQPGGDNSSISMTTNPDGSSNRPTPNSSGTSDVRRNASRDAGSRDSYDASPSTTNENSLAEMEAAATRFLQQAMSNGFHAPGEGGGVSSDQPFHAIGTSTTVDYTIASDWDPMGGQTGVTPVAEGVLRSLMNNGGPIDSMDFGWDTGP